LAFIKDGIANDFTVGKMTLGWLFGVGAKSRTFINDRMANEMRNSPGVNALRDLYYTKGVTYKHYDFGLKGLWDAGFSPVEQFVGSYDVYAHLEGNFLQFTITNTTSFSSFDYHLTPPGWNWNSGPMGNFTQTYIFTEPLR
jgi:hypothetical protein